MVSTTGVRRLSLLAAIAIAVASSSGSAAAQVVAPAQAPLRQGFWFNGGLGMGSMGVGCDGCTTDRTSGVSGGLAVGGTFSQRLLIGAQTAGWVKSEDGVSLNVASLNAVVRFYPSATGRFFLLGGLGYGTVTVGLAGYGSESETGTSAILGLGYDIRLNDKVSFTPFWNGYAVQINGGNANVGQLGLGLTFH